MIKRNTLPTQNMDELRDHPYQIILWDIYVERYNVDEIHQHNYDELLFSKEGDGEHDIDFRTYNIRSHSIHFVEANIPHQVRRDKPDIGCCLLFHRNYIMDESNLAFKDHLFYLQQEHLVCKLEETIFNTVWELLIKLHTSSENMSLLKMDKIELLAYLNLLLIKIKPNKNISTPNNRNNYNMWFK